MRTDTVEGMTPVEGLPTANDLHRSRSRRISHTNWHVRLRSNSAKTDVTTGRTHGLGRLA